MSTSMEIENDLYKTNSFVFHMSEKLENIELFTVASFIILDKPVFMKLIISGR